MAQQQVIEHEAFVIHPSVSRDRARVYAFMSPDRVKHIIDDLPCGWTVYGVRRKHGRTAGRNDLYLYSPDGQKFRSSKDIQRYVETQDQMLTGEGTKQRSALDDGFQADEELFQTSVIEGKRKRSASFSDGNSRNRKKVSQSPPASSLPAAVPNKRKRGRPRKIHVPPPYEDYVTPPPAEVNPARPADALPGTPSAASKRKQRKPMKSFGTLKSDQKCFSDDSNVCEMLAFTSQKENKENVGGQGKKAAIAADLAGLSCNSSENRKSRIPMKGSPPADKNGSKGKNLKDLVNVTSVGSKRECVKPASSSPKARLVS